MTAQRDAWYWAACNARQNPTGGLRPGPDNKSFFYAAVMNRKNPAFGTSLNVPKGGTVDAGAFPWALDDASFDTLNAEVKQGRGPAGAKEVTWKSLTDGAEKWRQDHGLSTPVAAFGWVVITGLVKK